MRSTTVWVLTGLLLLVAVAAARISASDPGTGDWPMWGGSGDRNMVSAVRTLKQLVIQVGRGDRDHVRIGGRDQRRRFRSGRGRA